MPDDIAYRTQPEIARSQIDRALAALSRIRTLLDRKLLSREGKGELGLDPYEVRGWRCVRRHFFVTQLRYLFCARIRQEYDESPCDQWDRITVEQVRSAMNAWIDTTDLPQATRRQRFKQELDKQESYQRRNKQTRNSHIKTRLIRLVRLGIEPDQIKSCLTKQDDESR